MGHQKSKLSPTELTAILNKTDFNESEIRSWYKSFLKECPGGTLTLEQFKSYCIGFFAPNSSSEYAEHAFKSFDTNQNGVIDFREFMCALSVTSRGTFDQKLKWAFRMYDTDNDGSISKEEMRLMIKAIYNMVGEENLHQSSAEHHTAEQLADLIFSKMDKDGNSSVSAEEFIIAAKKDPSVTMLFHLGQVMPGPF